MQDDSSFFGICYITGGVCGSILYGVLLEYKRKYKVYLNMIAISSLSKIRIIFLKVIIYLYFLIVTLGFSTWTFYYGLLYMTCIATFFAGLSMLP